MQHFKVLKNYKPGNHPDLKKIFSGHLFHKVKGFLNPNEFRRHIITGNCSLRLIGLASRAQFQYEKEATKTLKKKQ